MRESVRLAYTVFLEITYLEGLFQGVKKIIKQNEHYILFDTHPFMRPFAGYLDKLVIQKTYYEVGSFTQFFAYHWRVQDYINALSKEGFLIDEMQEFSVPKGFLWNEFLKKKLDETVYDWHCNPLAALPQYILISAAKK